MEETIHAIFSKICLYTFVTLCGYILKELCIKIDRSRFSEGILGSISTWYAGFSLRLPTHKSVKPVDVNSSSGFTRGKIVNFIICLIGLNTFYLTWGMLQERIMTFPYEITVNNVSQVIKFESSEFVVLINRLFIFVVGFTILIFRKKLYSANIYDHSDPPIYIYGLSSLSNQISSFAQYESLKYVKFALQVVFKASKLIPVMIIGTVLSRIVYNRREYLSASIVCIGFSLFLYGSTNSKDSLLFYEESTSAALFGVFLLVLYLVSDSFTSNWQSHIFKTYSTVTLLKPMTYSALLGIIYSIGLLLISKNTNVTGLLLKYSIEFRAHLFITGICSSIGQLFIFYTIKSLGPVIFTLIMMIRQIVSIILSVIIYKHGISSLSIFGICVIFGALIIHNILK